MQGIPGSGKSTVAKTIAHDYMLTNQRPAAIRSTDDFWYEVVAPEHGLTYSYDPARRAEAHHWNQQRVIEDMQAGRDLIIVDNTNIERWQAEPYFTLANIFDYEVSVVRVSVTTSLAVQRQENRPEDRRVPTDVIMRMAEDMEDLLRD